MVDDEVVKTGLYCTDQEPSTPPPCPSTSSAEEEKTLSRGDKCYRLEQLAYLRSGDKGNTANIGELNSKVYG